uniref:Uncharacterized protein n=1 Tax=Arundo donax TaxID=35708 RepID=A0A0A9BJY4_ARUDO
MSFYKRAHKKDTNYNSTLEILEEDIKEKYNYI